MSIPLLCIALLVILSFGLGFNVSMARAKTQTNFGYREDPEDTLYKAVRAHGNAIEYVPMLALLFYILDQLQPATWELWGIVLVTVFRILAAIGILLPHTMNKPNPIRFVGSLGTYLGGLALSVGLLFRAIAG
ncbi:MAPEG family protein [Spongiibacter nanhainus]|uniref:MAPEG family protein n=1 Tax=Spongiibacter nanhainus TaxID=2794344 RepID=A0A7T4UQE1_9GAMM|nr:MAPEG family protein [Spongiibacter nanhainus]QQD18591.1 MAPEG family protein [Spongiibacter nanhainus]